MRKSNYINKYFKNKTIISFINGTLWNLLGALFSRGILFFLTIVAARILEVETFGKFGIIKSTVNTYVLFASFGLGVTATKYVSEFFGTDNDKVQKIIVLTKWFAILTSGVTFILFLFFSGYISSNILNAPEIKIELQLASMILVIVALNGVYSGVLIGLKKFKSLAVNNTIGGFLTFPLQVYFLYEWGLIGAILGLLIYYLLLLLLNIYSTNKQTKAFIKVKYNFSLLKPEFKIIKKFTVPVFLTNLLVTPIMWFGSIFLVNGINGYSENAIYEGAKQINQLVIFIPFIISQITLPMLSSEKNNDSKFNRIMKLNLFVVGVSTFFIAFVISIFSSHVMKVYGNFYEEGNRVLIIMVFTAIFMGLTNILGKVYASKDKMWLNLRLSILWAVEFIILSHILVQIYDLGAIGLATAYFGSYTLHFIQSFVLLRTSKLLHEN